ncbi:MAG: hypothetical protein AUG53_09525 [Delftia sp. 13_1_20CM_4_67_18]|nr:MAG: hypothetical protein AUG53_09525 [Delftia sp. 13_1_20CM_4_67_18]
MCKATAGFQLLTGLKHICLHLDAQRLKLLFSLIGKAQCLDLVTAVGVQHRKWYRNSKNKLVTPHLLRALHTQAQGRIRQALCSL